jgi:hypothetical protein
MNKKKITVCIIFSLLLLTLGSCAARIQGRLAPDTSGDFTITTNLEPRMAGLIKSFQIMAGEDPRPEVPIIKGEDISQSMASAPGVKSALLKNTAPAALSGPVKITKIGDFLAPAGGQGFIRLEQAANGAGGAPNSAGINRLTIDLSLESGPAMLSLLSGEVADYLTALMAPIATGESVEKDQYLLLVSSVYGSPIAGEISRSAIQASIDFPGPITAVKGGTFSGNKAEFVIPLLDLLVLEHPLSYEVTWK